MHTLEGRTNPRFRRFACPRSDAKGRRWLSDQWPHSVPEHGAVWFVADVLGLVSMESAGSVFYSHPAQLIDVGGHRVGGHLIGHFIGMTIVIVDRHF